MGETVSAVCSTNIHGHFISDKENFELEGGKFPGLKDLLSPTPLHQGVVL